MDTFNIILKNTQDTTIIRGISADNLKEFASKLEASKSYFFTDETPAFEHFFKGEEPHVNMATFSRGYIDSDNDYRLLVETDHNYSIDLSEQQFNDLIKDLEGLVEGDMRSTTFGEYASITFMTAESPEPKKVAMYTVKIKDGESFDAVMLRSNEMQEFMDGLKQAAYEESANVKLVHKDPNRKDATVQIIGGQSRAAIIIDRKKQHGITMAQEQAADMYEAISELQQSLRGGKYKVSSNVMPRKQSLEIYQWVTKQSAASDMNPKRHLATIEMTLKVEVGYGVRVEDILGEFDPEDRLPVSWTTANDNLHMISDPETYIFIPSRVRLPFKDEQSNPKPLYTKKEARDMLTDELMRFVNNATLRTEVEKRINRYAGIITGQSPEIEDDEDEDF